MSVALDSATMAERIAAEAARVRADVLCFCEAMGPDGRESAAFIHGLLDRAAAAVRRDDPIETVLVFVALQEIQG